MVRVLSNLGRAHYDVDATFDRGGLELYLRTEAECRGLLRHRRQRDALTFIRGAVLARGLAAELPPDRPVATVAPRWYWPRTH
jgi:hypothetical protein